jgi:hypothetical protein
MLGMGGMSLMTAGISVSNMSQRKRKENRNGSNKQMIIKFI